MVEDNNLKLGDLLEKNIIKKSIKDNELVTFIPMESVSEDGRLLEQYVMRQSEVKKGLTYFEKNDVIVAKITPCFENGKGACLDELETNVGYGSTEFHVLRARKDAVPKYIYYHTHSNHFRRKLEREMIGSAGQKRVPLNLILKYPLKVSHSTEEQYKIAKVLSDIDKLIDSIKKLIDKKNRIKKGVMQELLTGKRRLKGFTEDWENKKLMDITSFTNGKAHENSISDNGKYIVVNSKFISSDGKEVKYSNDCFCVAYKDNILMVMSDVPNGKAIAKCFYVDQDYRYTVNQRVCLLRAQTVNPKFLYYKINRHQYFLSFDDGVKQTNLRKDDILNCQIKIPKSEKEQEAIAQLLSDMELEIVKLETKLKKYKDIKQGIMQELLTGRIRLI